MHPVYTGRNVLYMDTNTTTTTAALTIACPLCQAPAGARCQTVFSTRQEDGSYLKSTGPARTHAKRTAKAAKAGA